MGLGAGAGASGHGAAGVVHSGGMTVLHFVDFGPANPGADSAGSAPAVVFLGSIASTTDMWLPQLDALSRDHRVIAIDHPGHGRSPAPDAAAGETTIASLAAGVLETLGTAGVDTFAVVGLSLGGAIAQYLAARCDRVERAVFMCTGAYMGGPDVWAPRAEQTRAHGIAPRVEGAVELWVTEAFRASRPATTEALHRMVASTRGAGYAACADALAGWDFRGELAEITVPVLTIAGPADTSTPPEVVHAIAEGVGGEAQSVTLSAGGHVPTVEVPGEATAALREFLAG